MIRLSPPAVLTSVIVLDGNIVDWPFWNRQVKEGAEALLEQLHDMRE